MPSRGPGLLATRGGSARSDIAYERPEGEYSGINADANNISIINPATTGGEYALDAGQTTISPSDRKGNRLFEAGDVGLQRIGRRCPADDGPDSQGAVAKRVSPHDRVIVSNRVTADLGPFVLGPNESQSGSHGR